MNVLAYARDLALPLTLALAILAPTAQAEAPPEARTRIRQAQAAFAPLPGGSPREKLASAFERGSVPTREDLVGIWSGRSWKIQNPDAPVPALMIASQEDESRRGPLIPGQLTVTAVYNPRGKPQHFDDPATLVEMWGTLMDVQARHRCVYQPEDGVLRKPTPRFLDQELRVYQGFPVLRTTQDGEVQALAYFFLRRSPEDLPLPGAAPQD